MNISLYFIFILQISTNDLPEHLQKLYINFVNDYRRDIERYHIQHASQYIDEYRLKNFDWNIRVNTTDIIDNKYELSFV